MLRHLCCNFRHFCSDIGRIFGHLCSDVGSHLRHLFSNAGGNFRHLCSHVEFGWHHLSDEEAEENEREVVLEALDARVRVQRVVHREHLFSDSGGLCGLGPASPGRARPQWLQRHPEAGSSWPSWPKAT